MANKDLDEALLDTRLVWEEDIRLIADNPLVAQTVAASIRRICDFMHGIPQREDLLAMSQYRGRIRPSKLREAVEKVYRRDGVIHVTVVAREMGFSNGYFSQLFARHPEIEALYQVTCSQVTESHG